MAVNYYRLNVLLKCIALGIACAVIGVGLGVGGSLFYYIVL
jgi:hypothetical protein